MSRPDGSCLHLNNNIQSLFREKQFLSQVLKHLFSGLEEFEEKIDKIAEGQDSGDDNWISKIYNQFSFFNDVDNSLSESDLDGIEPPILDETWGLGLRNSSTFKSRLINTNRRQFFPCLMTHLNSNDT